VCPLLGVSAQGGSTVFIHDFHPQNDRMYKAYTYHSWKFQTVLGIGQAEEW